MARPTAAADVFRAIADSTRRGLLDGLLAGEASVGQLAAAFDVSLPAISQHLRVLREAGLVSERRVGRERRYRVKPKPLRQVVDWVQHFERFWNERLDALGRHIEENP